MMACVPSYRHAMPDADKDGLSDFVEGWYGTDPNVADTDRDGMSDGDEVSIGFDPTKAEPDKIATWNASMDIERENLDKAYDDAAGMFRDTDFDGVDNYTERKIGTNPFEADTDKDGLDDGFEVQYGLDPLDNLPDPVEPAPVVPMRLPDDLNAAVSSSAAASASVVPAPAVSSPAPVAAPAADPAASFASEPDSYASDSYASDTVTEPVVADPPAGASPDPVDDESSYQPPPDPGWSDSSDGGDPSSDAGGE